ncbi:MAG: YfhO family protein [Anaerolineae bacterium]|nr:YfhO family protein [Anaerolineae bacterium]
MILLYLSFLLLAVATSFARLRRSAVALDLSAWLLLGFMAVGFHWRLVTGDAFAPAGGGDLASFLYPYYTFAARSLQRGQIPLWNPYVFSGMPFIGDVQNGLLYPPNLALFLLQPRLTYPDMQAMSVLHLWLAGGLTFTCLHHLPGLGLGRGPALLGATAFMFSDIFVMHFGNLNLIAVAAWLPLVFLLFAQSLERQSAALAGWAGATLGISALAGHIQPTIYNGLFLALLALHRTWVGVMARQGRRGLWPLALLLVAAMVAAAVSAPVMVPSLVLSGHTVRADFTYWQASRYSLTPFRTLGLLIPDLTGRDPSQYWGLGDRVETGYLGLLPLLLALFATWRLVHRPWARFFSLAAVFFFALALGDTLPVHGWLFRLVPGLGLLRAPARALYLTDFALAGLAAMACHSLAQSSGARLRRSSARFARAIARVALYALPAALAASLLALLLLQDRDPVIFARAWGVVGSLSRAALFLSASLAVLCSVPLLLPVRRQTWMGAAIALTFLDLFSAGAYLDLGRSSPATAFQHQEAVSFLKTDPYPHRVDVDPSAWSLWPPNLGCVHEIEHVRGVPNPMELARYQSFLELTGDRSSRLYQLLGAKYLVVAKGVVPPEHNFVPAFGEDPEVDIYLNTAAYPLAVVVPASVSAAGPEESAGIVSAPDFDPTGVVVLEGEAPQVAATSPDPDLHFSVWQPDRIGLGIAVREDTYLVLSLPFAPGWSATLDGNPVPVWPADLAFTAVHVPTGSHTIELVYRPPLLVPSLLLAVAALGATVGLTARERRR